MSTTSHDLLPLSEIARRYDLHVSTVYRWCLRGVRGRRLRSIMLGGTRRVRADDVEEFIAACTAAAEPVPQERITPPAWRKRQHARAERECEAAGL